MKKLFEKPMFHYTFVLTVVALVCGIMIGLVNAVTSPIIAANIEKAQTEAYKRVLPEIDSFVEITIENGPATVLKAVEAKNASDATIGYIYTAYTTNKFGYMRLVISVGTTGMILGADFIEINQTYLVEGTKTNLSRFVGGSITSLAPSGDIVTGATGSLNSLKALLSDVAAAHAIAAANQDPLAAWFGAGYVMDAEVDPTFVPNANVISKKLVRNSGGVVIAAYYHVRGSSVYNTEEGSAGTINMYVGLSTSGTILGISLPQTEYGHTKSNAFYPKVVAYANSIVGTNVASFAGQGDLAAGATNSKVLVDTLLTALGGNN
jgi:Na+-translocating ferredoxin:NAD+ oxidoreductase RnfG subunit